MELAKPLWKRGEMTVQCKKLTRECNCITMHGILSTFGDVNESAWILE